MIFRAALVFLFLGLSSAWAQISPGALSEPHSHLEGSDKCLGCHSQKRRVAADRCLDCHELLRLRIEAGRGYHASLGDQGCEQCHMEHHGAEFELVWWGDDGEKGFDHQKTGFDLRGAHLRQSCRGCHQTKLVKSKSQLLEMGKQLDRTYLGLEGSSCLSCHEDWHRGQFEQQACADCHDSDAWKPASRFRHEQTLFALKGKHSDVTCIRCHSQQVELARVSTAVARIRWVGLSHSSCTDCHRDPHLGNLGSKCEECHSESGWSRVDRKKFDHDRTRFALRGAHIRSGCDSCHRSGESSRIQHFEACADCHREEHLGQFADRADAGACEGCHDDQRFRPANFELAEHQVTSYPLEGAHLAVPCNSCHELKPARQIPGTSLGVTAKTAGSRETAQFRFADTRCLQCHRDPHEKTLPTFIGEGSCESCHHQQAWNRIAFDHARTEYKLEGRHLDTTCRKCHEVESAGEESTVLEFRETSSRCFDCHPDPHAGQFLGAKDRPECGLCHSSARWAALSFDHNRDSTFNLDGVHLRVPCADCHPTESRGDQQIVRYKPLEARCVDCHNAEIVTASGR